MPLLAVRLAAGMAGSTNETPAAASSAAADIIETPRRHLFGRPGLV